MKKQQVIKLSLFALFLGIVLKIDAQRNFTLYQFQNTHQSLYLNPAFRPDIKRYTSAGLGMGSLGLNHTGFVINDLFVRRASDDSIEFNVSNALSKLADVNDIGIDLQNEIFGMGFRVKNTHLMFSVVMKNQAHFFYPRDLFRFAFEGNGASLLGQTADLTGLGFKLNVFTEYSAGFNHTFFKDNLSVGARVKVISGLYNAHTTRSELGMNTNDSTFDISINGALQVNSSYMNPLINRNYFEGIRNGINFRNLGFGLDLGGQLKLANTLELSASLIDLGFIKWNGNNKNFVSEDVNFSFQGVDINQFMADSTDYLRNLLDTIKGSFNGTQNSEEYVTSLNTRFFIGARMKVIPTLYANALWFNEFVLGNYMPGFSMGGTFQVREVFTVSANYMVYGRFAKNIGMGINFRFKRSQFFVSTDNLIGLINLKSTKNVHATIGVSSSIGRPDYEKRKLEEDKKRADQQIAPPPPKQ
jgi:hypothetical protein